MKKQAFSHITLAKSIYPQDFYKDDDLSDDVYREKLVNEAFKIANKQFSDVIHVKEISQGNKKIYSSEKLTETLVLRKCTSNLAYVSEYKVSQRNQITKEIKCFLREGTQFRIYKLDIKSFFESISTELVQASLASLESLSPHTKNLVMNYLENFNEAVPRGIEISPVLSDLVLKNFDKITSTNNNVFYYARFVDDIIIITSSFEKKKDFMKTLSKNLPKGLIFNHNKKKIIDVKKRCKSGDNISGRIVADFEFLGYQFQAIDTHLEPDDRSVMAKFRLVKIELSRNKIKKYKTKICSALINFRQSGDFHLLKDRINFLTTNRDLIQKSTNRGIPTGIYYSFSQIDSASLSIKDLDEALQKFVMSSNTMFSGQGSNPLSLTQKRALLKKSFKTGFEQRVFKKFSPDRLKEITEIWR
jgi:hypothetical protein